MPQQPLFMGYGEESSEQPIESDTLAIADETRAVAIGPILEALLKRLAKRRCVLVSHAGTSPRRRSMTT